MSFRKLDRYCKGFRVCRVCFVNPCTLDERSNGFTPLRLEDTNPCSKALGGRKHIRRALPFRRSPGSRISQVLISLVLPSYPQCYPGQSLAYTKSSLYEKYGSEITHWKITGHESVIDQGKAPLSIKACETEKLVLWDSLMLFPAERLEAYPSSAAGRGIF